jgi:hypothetical protein
VHRSLVCLPLVGLLAACAATPAADPARAGAPERQCFSPQQIDNFRSGPSFQTLYVRARGSGVYELTTAGACNDLDTAQRLAVVPEMGAHRLCTDEWAALAVPGTAAPLETCRARIEKKLTDAEVAALPARYRP